MHNHSNKGDKMKAPTYYELWIESQERTGQLERQLKHTTESFKKDELTSRARIAQLERQLEKAIELAATAATKNAESCPEHVGLKKYNDCSSIECIDCMARAIKEME
jgi:hypothetical protein